MSCKTAEFNVNQIVKVISGETVSYPKPAGKSLKPPRRHWNCQKYNDCLSYAVRMRNIENQLNLNTNFWLNWCCPDICQCYGAKEQVYSELQAVYAGDG